MIAIRSWNPFSESRTDADDILLIFAWAECRPGEVKKIGFDPLFSLNHTYALLGFIINRPIRKTYCTPRDSRSLKDHIDLFFEILLLEAFTVICHGHHPKLESLVVARKPSVILLCPKDTGSWMKQSQGFRIEFGLVQCSQGERCCRTYV
jgi:hypothetical protein